MFTRILIFATLSLVVSPFSGIVFAEEKGKGDAKPTGTIHVIEDEVYKYDPESPPPTSQKKPAPAPDVEMEKEQKKTEPPPALPEKRKRFKMEVMDDEDYGEKPAEDIGKPVGEDFNLELRGAYWLATLNTSLRVDSGELKGTEVDLVDDLGLSRQTGFPIGEVTLKFFERHKLKVDFVRISYSARKLVQEEFVFNGVAYPAESDVATELDIQSIRFGYETDLYRGDKGYFALRLAGDYLKTKASLVTNDALYNKADLTFVAPLLALAGRWNAMPWLSITLDVAGVGYDRSYIYDGTIYFDINPVRNAGLTFGWRSITLNVEIDDKKAFVQWSGPYAGMIIRF